MAHIGLRVGVTALVKALLHRALELIGDLRVSVTMKDAPGGQGRLRVHLALNLSIQVTCIRLDVNRLRSSARASSHLEPARRVLEALKLLRVLVELQVPEALLLDALSIRLEVLHQVLDLLNFGIGVRVHDLGKIFHEAEVGAHGVSQTG